MKKKNKKKINIEYNRETCIGCATCVSVADDYWDFSDTENETVDLKEGVLKEDEIFTREGKPEDAERLVECQDICPTESIKVEVDES